MIRRAVYRSAQNHAAKQAILLGVICVTIGTPSATSYGQSIESMSRSFSPQHTATMKIISTILVSVMAIGCLSAQQNIVYNDAATGCAGGNAFPFGSEGIRYQTVMSGAALTQVFIPVVIRDLFVGGQPNGGGNYVSYEDIEIKMGLTQQDPTLPLATDWNTNNPNPTVVYRGPLAINFEPGVWKGIGLPVPYVFQPMSATDNLCVEVIVWSAQKMTNGGTTGPNFYFPAASSNVQRAFRYQWTSNQVANPPMVGTAGCCMGFLLGNGNFVTHGQYGISSTISKVEISGSTYPQPGKALDIYLTGGGPSRASFLAFGFTYAPFDMTVIGAPRSNIWFSPLLQIGTASDPQGNITIPVVIPATLTTGTIYAQWYQIDPGAYKNTLGLVTSDCATIIFGN